jgi:hypothetical protein
MDSIEAPAAAGSYRDLQLGEGQNEPAVAYEHTSSYGLSSSDPRSDPRPSPSPSPSPSLPSSASFAPSDMEEGSMPEEQRHVAQTPLPEAMLPPSQTCDRCYENQQRCDDRRPTCVNCANLGRACFWTPVSHRVMLRKLNLSNLENSLGKEGFKAWAAVNTQACVCERCSRTNNHKNCDGYLPGCTSCLRADVTCIHHSPTQYPIALRLQCKPCFGTRKRKCDLKFPSCQQCLNAGI